jgi:hypothetical protein
MLIDLFPTPQFAVIPIVVNAGAALLPAILAAVTTFVALLFKPREMIRVCRLNRMCRSSCSRLPEVSGR